MSNRQISCRMPPQITRVLAVDKLREATALLGFTRIDEMDRVLRPSVPPGAAGHQCRRPGWSATENRGEGVFLELDEAAVAAWETRVEIVLAVDGPSGGAQAELRQPDLRDRDQPRPRQSRFQPPRYWLLHTLAHVLMREMAMSSGYGAASLSERIYAWRGHERTPAAAGLLLLTTSSDSDGTLGGLVQLSEPSRLPRIVDNALRRASRCSSDPVCAYRTPADPRGLPARCRLPLLHDGVRDVLRAGQPLPRPPLPGAAARPVRGSGLLPGAVVSEDAVRHLGQLLTGTEAQQLADLYADGATLTQALQAVSSSRRQDVRAALEASGMVPRHPAAVPVLRAIQGANARQTTISPVWTLPGYLADYGSLTTSLEDLVLAARHSVTCSTFNFQTSSALWKALRDVAGRGTVDVRVYLDTEAAEGNPGWGVTPTCEDVANHLAGRTCSAPESRRQAPPQPRQVRRRRPPVPDRHQRQLLQERRAAQHRTRPARRLPLADRASREAASGRRGVPLRGRGIAVVRGGRHCLPVACVPHVGFAEHSEQVAGLA